MPTDLGKPPMPVQTAIPMAAATVGTHEASLSRLNSAGGSRLGQR